MISSVHPGGAIPDKEPEENNSDHLLRYRVDHTTRSEALDAVDKLAKSRQDLISWSRCTIC
jgi:hypothetical protein